MKYLPALCHILGAEFTHLVAVWIPGRCVCWEVLFFLTTKRERKMRECLFLCRFSSDLGLSLRFTRHRNQSRCLCESPHMRTGLNVFADISGHCIDAQRKRCLSPCAKCIQRSEVKISGAWRDAASYRRLLTLNSVFLLSMTLHSFPQCAIKAQERQHLI